MRKVIIFICLLMLFYSSTCKKENNIKNIDDKSKVVHLKRPDFKGVIPEQGMEAEEYIIDTIYYQLKPLGKYSEVQINYFTDSVLCLWNQISLQNIKKIDPNLADYVNYNRYQILKAGDMLRLEFWRTINKYYSHWYDFDRGFYVVEIFSENPSPNYYLISPTHKNEYYYYGFHFDLWSDSQIAYLNRIGKIDFDLFFDYYSEIKEQKVTGLLAFKALSEFDVSFFYKDTIESYMNIGEGNFEVVGKMKKLFDEF